MAIRPIKGQRSPEEQDSINEVLGRVSELDTLERDLRAEVATKTDAYMSVTEFEPSFKLRQIISNIFEYQLSYLYNKKNQYFKVRYDAYNLPMKYDNDKISKFLWWNRKKMDETGHSTIGFGEEHKQYIRRLISIQ